MTADACRALLLAAFQAGVDACLPSRVVPQALPKTYVTGRRLIIAIGKAAPGMAAAALAHSSGEVIGLVVAPPGSADGNDLGGLRLVEAGHPVPDFQSLVAGCQAIELARTARPTDEVLFLISGGGSALLCAPIAGVSAAQKQDVNRFLVLSGAPIAEINRVRSALSRVKGGRLAAIAGATGARLRTLIISDVVGDDPALVASAPSICSDQNAADAIGVLRRYGYPVDRGLEQAIRNAVPTTRASHPVRVLASNADALNAVCKTLAQGGVEPVNLGDEVDGDASTVGRSHAEIVRGFVQQRERKAIVSGGELTVRVGNRAGRGGPNLEYLAGLGLALPPKTPVIALACDSDGIDGSGPHAGGILTGESLSFARQAGHEPDVLLASNKSFDLFSAIQGLVVTGQTGTNVNDVRIILVNA